MIPQNNGAIAAQNPQIIPADFMLRDKIGGSFAKIVTADKIKIAEEALMMMQADILNAIKPMLNEIAGLARVRSRDSVAKIWKHAHEIRGLAGSAQRKSLGEICNIICHYLNDIETEDFRPDANLITVLSVSASHAAREDADIDPETEIMVEECRNAVMVQKQREGRNI